MKNEKTISYFFLCYLYIYMLEKYNLEKINHNLRGF